MKESAKTERLTLRWVPVVDARGRTHLEAVWVTATPRVHGAHAA